ncbi:helix-turn-helix transcriptional regulator [Microbacterium sp. JZ70]
MTIRTSPRTVGRESEHAQLVALFEAAERGEPALALVSGEAGIGKSRLVSDLAAAVGGRARVLVGHCVDLGRVGEAYTPFTAALRVLIADLGVDRVRELAGPGAAALSGMAPALASEAEPTGQQPYEALAHLLETASREQPVVLVLEDVHWMDRASLGVLAYLARVSLDARLLVVATYRPEDIGRTHPARDLLGELARSRATTRVELGRLDREDVRALVGELTGTAVAGPQLDAIAARSDGVPFYLEELVAVEGCDDERALPGGLRSLLLARYERLSDPARALARALSVGGLSVAHALLERVDGLDATARDAALREALDAGLLVLTDDGYAFRHALVREAILEDALPGERERLHERYAEALEERASSGARVAAAVAHHLASTRDAARAFPASIRAMQEARASSAYASAAQHAEQALAMWDAVPDPESTAGMPWLELMGRAATYLRNAGETERSIAVSRSALAACPPDSIHHVRLTRNLARALSNAARPGSIEAYRDALATVERIGGHEELRVDLLISLAGRLMLAGERADARRLALEGAAVAERLGATALVSNAMNVAGLCLAHGGDLAAGWAELEQARQLAGDDRAARLRYWVNASDLAQRAGDPERALELARLGMAEAQAYGLERTSGTVLASNAADPLASLGRWDEVDALIDRALAASPPSVNVTYLAVVRAWSLVWRGDLAAAAATLEPHRAVLRSTAENEIQALLTVARVDMELALADGRPEVAWDAAAGVRAVPVERLALNSGNAVPLAWSFARVARLAGRRGGHAFGQEAGRLAERLIDQFAGWPTHGVWSALTRAELADDEPSWRAAAAAAEGREAPVGLLPYALAQQVRARVEAGDRAGARALVPSARAAARERGVLGVLRDLDALADEAGLQGRDGHADPVLTARELQVLELVAEGLSNGQIGQRLFISTKTVSVHVSAILRKLGAATRTEAAHRAADLLGATAP